MGGSGPHGVGRAAGTDGKGPIGWHGMVRQAAKGMARSVRAARSGRQGQDGKHRTGKAGLARDERKGKQRPDLERNGCERAGMDRHGAARAGRILVQA